MPAAGAPPRETYIEPEHEPLPVGCAPRFYEDKIEVRGDVRRARGELVGVGGEVPRVYAQRACLVLVEVRQPWDVE